MVRAVLSVNYEFYKMSSEEIEELKASIDIVDIVENFIDLDFRGSYYTGLCPFHNNTSLDTFKVYQNRGYYRCYSCGASGDSIEFLKQMGNNFKDSLSILKGEKEVNGVAIKKTERSPVAEFVYIKPIKRFTREDYKHKKYGYPDNVYEYFGIDGVFIGSVIRFNLPDGSKYTPPFNSRICVKKGYAGQKKGKSYGKWFEIGDIDSTCFGFNTPKPIYGIQNLKAKPDAPILFVEGEKTCDFVRERCHNSVALSCTGGTNNTDKTDFSSIKGKTVYLIPDNDWSHTDKEGVEKPKEEQPSIKFFSKLKAILEVDNDVIWVDTYDRSKPCGWDIADTDWDAKQITEFIKANMIF